MANSESGLQEMGMFAMCAFAEREAGFLPLPRDTQPYQSPWKGYMELLRSSSCQYREKEVSVKR